MKRTTDGDESEAARARRAERRRRREVAARRQMVVYALAVVGLAAAYWNAQSFGARTAERASPREAALREAARDMFPRFRESDGDASAALSPDDRASLDEQRALVRELAREHVGLAPRGGALEDLPILQQLVDAHVVAPTDAYAQQALGVVLGDVMAEQLGLEWAIVDDDLGRSRALRLGKTGNWFFPVTMISRRYGAHARSRDEGLLDDGGPRYGAVDVDALYRETAEAVARLRAAAEGEAAAGR